MPNNQTTTWVVVADNCQAKIFQVTKFPKLKEISHFEHPESKLHNQDLVSSKQGRTFQSSGTARSSYQPETEPKKHEAILFATEIARHLESAKNKGEYSRLYLLAEPSFLGLLRQHINGETKKSVVGEIAKELTAFDTKEIEEHLSSI